MQCKYVKQDGSRCNREALPDSRTGYCILHEHGDYKDEEETKREFYREIEEGITDFVGCILPGFDLSGRTFKGDLVFVDARIKGDVWFDDEAEIERDINFTNATVEGEASFRGVIVGGHAIFEEARIGRLGGSVDFEGATVNNSISFFHAEIKGGVNFKEATIGTTISFERATIEGDIFFNSATIGKDLIIGTTTVIFRKATIVNAWFSEATIRGVLFDRKATIKGYLNFSNANIYELSFVGAKFHEIRTQEEACRVAKTIQEKLGNRDSADSHFYREMVARRKQKYKTFSLEPILKLIRKLRLEGALYKYTGFLEKKRRIYWGFLEFPLQYPFGYGVHPFWVIGAWLLTVFCLAFVYWIGNGVEAADSLVEYIYFSVVTAATPGYGGYKPVPGFYQGLATFEAIFGTFMWAAFIATFARKYMR